MKFIHAADIHLDSPLVGLKQYEGAPVREIRGATRRALENLVELAINESAAFVLCAGDLFDGDWKDYNTGLFFTSQMSKLRDANIRMFLVAGNHDAASQISKNLRMPDNVKTLSARKPESVVLEDLDVAIHGQGFGSRAVTDDLAAMYPKPVSGLLNIGLLHTSVNGRAGHEPYAPCSLDELRGKGYQYWALGHVHAREVLHEDPWIVFPGNVQGRHVRESGPKGCVLVTVEDGDIVTVDHRDLDVLRWTTLSVDADGADTGDDVIERVAAALNRQVTLGNDIPVAVRIEIVGACRANAALVACPEQWVNEIRSLATDVSGGMFWVEKVEFHTRSRISLEEIAQRDDAFGGLARAIHALNRESDALAGLSEELKVLELKLPQEMRQGEDGVGAQNPEYLRDVIENAKQFLLERLVSAGESL